MPPDELFTREEVLGGLPAKRAATLLFLIESRTAHLSDQSRRALEFYLTEAAAQERDLAFLEAFTLGREPPLRPTVQDLERYAPRWAPLVPKNPGVQAAVAHLLGRKYTFTYRAVPGIRAALGLDDDAVRSAYQRQYREPLETLYASRPTLSDHLRWVWAAVAGWSDFLPVFWVVFVLTVALPLPTAILALPIALAHVGPMSGILFVVVIGLFNVLTMACMAEACARSGAIRYGRAFWGRLVSDFLGGTGSSVLSIALGIRNFLALVSSSFGMAITMMAFTHVPAEVWIAFLFVIELYLLSRKTLKLTITAMVLLAATNIVLLLPIALLGFGHAQLENLLSGRIPFLGGEPFNPQIFRLVFGVILSLYFGHAYVVHCAKIVLRRDPSARALIRGSIAGTACIIFLLALWVLAIGGAIAPEVLANESGTALTPLAQRLGPTTRVLGSLLIVFFLGMSCIRTANILFNLVHERLPSRLRFKVMLLRRRGSLVLCHRGTPRGSPCLGLTYLGLTDGHPQFRLDVQWNGNIQRMELVVPDQWDADALFEQLPELRSRQINVRLETLEATPDGVRLCISTSMRLIYEGEWDASGLDLAEAIVLPDPMRQLVTWLMRREHATLAELAECTGQDHDTTRAMLTTLVRQGFVQVTDTDGGARYRIRLGLRHRRQLSQEIWHALDVRVEGRANPSGLSPAKAALVSRDWLGQMLLGDRGRFLLSLSPVISALLLAEWLLLTGTGSFAWLFSFSGLITCTVISGIIPVLLLISSRQKAELVPAVVYRFLGHPMILAAIYVFFLGILFLHGLVIWQHPLERASAVSIGLLVVGVTIVMFRRGAFAQRAVIELRKDQHKGDQGVFAITVGGRPTPVDVRLGYSGGEERHQAASGPVQMISALRYASFQLSKTSARELKVWVHSITSEGSSEALPAVAEVHCGDQTRRFDLNLSGGQVLLPLTGEACWIRITLPEPYAA